ncbi:Gag polyprotein [Labeo rohita]|uniref:Gag polyprotein n=1 Tax=Labeo rohita TaxID=84645 RepID=A0ABQ8L8Y7_LABRO|nr:Gag polyprotein [Labeo rohita]
MSVWLLIQEKEDTTQTILVTRGARDHFGSSDQRFADRRGCVTARRLRRSPLPGFLRRQRSGSVFADKEGAYMFEDFGEDDFSPVKQSNVTFPMGRGGGPEKYHNERVSEITSRCYGRGRALNNVVDSAIGASVGPTASSTPITHPDAERVISPEALGSIISDLAQKIGESISASLNLAHQPSPVQHNPPSQSQHSSECMDASKLKVIVQQDSAPPPFFRGDKSDSFTIHEWEDMMCSYLNRMRCKTQTDVSDLMSRLAGKARDVVKPASTPAQSLPSVSHLNPNALPFSPDTSLRHMVGMMDRVLSLCTASLTLSGRIHASKTSDFKTNFSSACRVCRSKEHTTYSHCRRHRLCRHCLSPGHFKSDCPKAACPATPSDTAHPCDERGNMGDFNEKSLTDEADVQHVFVNSCKSLPEDKTVLYVGSQRVDGASELFYAPVTVCGCYTLKGLLDSGSMSCTLSEEGESKLQADGLLPHPQAIPSNVVLVGCGGLTIQPKCTYDLEIEVYGFKFVVPTLVVPGQRDEFIIGSNVIKCILQKMKSHDKYWELVSCCNSDPECEKFLELLSCISRWSGPQQPDKLGTVKLCQAVTVLPRREYLVWANANEDVTRGSSQSRQTAGRRKISDELQLHLAFRVSSFASFSRPTTARSAPKNILVGRVVTPMWGDRWVPMKILNPNPTAVTLRHNSKLADVSSCLAVEDLTVMQGLEPIVTFLIQITLKIPRPLILCSPLDIGLDTSMSTDDVSSILSSCDEWETGTECRATSFTEHLTSLISGDEEVFHSLLLTDLREHQHKDPVIARVLNFLPLPDTDSDGSGQEDAGSPTCSVPPQSDPTRSGCLTAQTYNDVCSYVAEIEPAEDPDDESNEAEELSQADCMFNISNVATCNDDRTASWMHSQLPSQQEPNLPRLAVPVADDNTVAGAGADPSPSFPNPVSNSVPVMQDPVADLNTADRYTTRFGRGIKPVRRLIESMVQLETLLGLDSGSAVIHA